MVESTDAEQHDHVAGLEALNRSPGRRVAVERHMGPVVVVEADVVPHEPSLMPLAENDDVIEQLVRSNGARPRFEVCGAWSPRPTPAMVP